jgi:hypothetical protein
MRTIIFSHPEIMKSPEAEFSAVGYRDKSQGMGFFQIKDHTQ